MAIELDPQSWSQIDRLLDEALDLPAAARDAWLESLSPELAALAPHLRDLLSRATEVETKDFLGTLPKLALERPPAADLESGESIGPYRLLREIGAGGMGSVWLAERADGLIRRPLALKLPHGTWQRTGLAERMAREREILGSLDHPSIARLLDAGVTIDGKPYLALELVEGTPIDQCAARLDTRGRVALFLQVVRAVAYAHGKLIVHRDLKPSNVLVTADGQVRLLDFGIAKLLEDGEAKETRLTEAAGRALTPDYASPEQIAGEPLTVASDVYSLGVVLYEILTGMRPYKLKRDSRGALEDAILQMDPQRPSDAAPAAARKALRGDLDTIVQKALKKRPLDRYATAHALAEDLERYLDRRPVQAQPDSAWYRTRKFVARNRAAVAASAAVALAILGGAGLAVWQAIEANQQRDVALREQRRAQAYSDFMSVLLQDAGTADRSLTTTELLDRGVTMLEGMTELDDTVKGFMWYELSRLFLMLRNANRESDLLARSAAAARRIGDFELLAASECSAAWSLAERETATAAGRLAAGQGALDRVRNPANYAVLDCLRAESSVLRYQGDLADAIALVERRCAELATGGSPQSCDGDLLMAQLGDLYKAAGRFRDHLALSERSLEVTRQRGRAGSMVEIVGLNNLAIALTNAGELAATARTYEEILAWFDHQSLLSARPVGIASNAGLVFWRLGDAERALALAESDYENSTQTGATMSATIAQLLMSRALLTLNRLDESTAQIEAAETTWQTNPVGFARMLQEGALQRAEILYARGDVAAARDLIVERIEALDYPTAKRAPGLERLLLFGAKAELSLGRPQLALDYATDAAAIYQRGAREEHSSADVGLATLLRAQALAELGRRAEALEAAERARLALTNGFGSEHAETRRAVALETGLRAAIP